MKTKNPTEDVPEYIIRLAGTGLEGGCVISGERGTAPDFCGDGQGASAYVIKAVDTWQETKAVKVLKKDANETTKKRFLDEIEKQKKVTHPNIVKVESVGTITTSDETTEYRLPYYVMEFVKGTSISKWAKTQEQEQVYLGAKDVCSIIRQILMALNHMHSLNPKIYHLDLKPANILVSTISEGGYTPKVGDFGLALATAPQKIISEPSLSGRPIEAMHPVFRKMFSQGIDTRKLEPCFDFYGLGYTLAKVESYLKHELTDFQRYIFDAIVLRLTCAEKNVDEFPSRSAYRGAELDVDEFQDIEDIFEAVEKLENPSYHFVKVPELHLESPLMPPVRIAGHKHVPTSARLRTIIDNPVFQRLQWMHQLDQVPSTYPGAWHTRHEHSIGVYYYTIRYLRRFLQEPYFVFHFSEEEVKATLLAGLLHDIGHYPMAHSIDESQEMSKLISHEKLGHAILNGAKQNLVSEDDQKTFLKDIVDLWCVNPKTIAGIAFSSKPLKAETPSTYIEHKHSLLHSIIDGPLDTDKMHYLQGDSIHTGNPVGENFDAEQLIDSLTFNEAHNGIAITDKGVAAVESFMYARYRMHIDVYWHHTVRGVRTMVTRAIDRYIRNPQKGKNTRRRHMKLICELCTDRDFLFVLLDQFKVGTPAGELIRGILHEEPRKDADGIKVIRPVRRIYKRIRTYTENGRGDGSSKQIYNKLCSMKDILVCEKRVVEKLEKLLKTPINEYEIIIDVPPRIEGKIEYPEVYSPNDESGTRCYHELKNVSSVAREIKDDFDRNSKKVRIYCSPRLKPMLSGYKPQLNDIIKEVI